MLSNSVADRVHTNLEDLRVAGEVAIRGEHGHPPAHGNGANQKIGIGALNASTAAKIEKSRSEFIVFSLQLQIRKSTQSFAQPFALFPSANPGKQFLSDWPDHRHAVVNDESLQLLGNCFVAYR